MVRPEERQYKDGLSGQTVFTYHARLADLELLASDLEAAITEIVQSLSSATASRT